MTPDREALAKRLTLATMRTMDPSVNFEPTPEMWEDAPQEDKDVMLSLADEAIAYMKEINNVE